MGGEIRPRIILFAFTKMIFISAQLSISSGNISSLSTKTRASCPVCCSDDPAEKWTHVWSPTSHQVAKTPPSPRNVAEYLWSYRLCPYLSGSVQHYLAKSTQLKATHGPKVPERLLLGQKLAAAPSYFTIVHWS